MKIKKAALKPLEFYVYGKEKKLYRTLKVQIGELIHMALLPRSEPWFVNQKQLNMLVKLLLKPKKLLIVQWAESYLLMKPMH